MTARIELIEDDALLAQQFVGTLAKAGYDVHHSSHAPGAMAAIDAHVPDCIVLDLLLPATTGFTLLHELQSYEDTRGIPVVVCSSVAVSLEELRPYGVVRVLDKTTMKPEDIATAVRAALL
jgi:CheY-like chemotaxis protein